MGNVSIGDILLLSGEIVKRMATKNLVKRFGEKLKSLRRSRNMTLKDLADALGYTTHGYISEIENNKKIPTVEFVINAARFFDVSTDVLLKDELEIVLTTIKNVNPE